MKKIFTSSLEIISRMIPLGLYPKILSRDVIDFFYHAVSDEPMPHVRHLYPVVPVDDFEAALIYLKENYTFINYERLHAHIFCGAPLPPKAVHLSFDDGYAECFSVVRPLLLRHQIPCTFFLTTSLIDNPILFYRNKQSLCIESLKKSTFNFQPLAFDDLPGNPALDRKESFISWLKDLRLPDESLIDQICEKLEVDGQAFLTENQPYLIRAQIRQMHAEGFTIGAHTITHRKLIDLTPTEIEAEIADSCRSVMNITGQNIVSFSFPHSAFGLDRSLLSAIRDRHPFIGLLFDTKGIRKDVDFIQNRIWAEKLPPTGWGLSKILLNAYQEAWVDEMMALGRKLRVK
jgi:peptidoglycan/xylan/chitin deacetylase (PgdA/CDA1 family)